MTPATCVRRRLVAMSLWDYPRDTAIENSFPLHFSLEPFTQYYSHVKYDLAVAWMIAC